MMPWGRPSISKRAGVGNSKSSSVAVRASAGSGKTRVLIDRFVRLCVEGEHNDVHPRSILAITFTRKAATEIRERLLDRARDLALCDEAERHAKLTALFAGRDAGPLRPVEVDRAARLYEKLLEDTGGLQVGTIHSFCQLILNRFAVEAGLDPRFTVIEDPHELHNLAREHEVLRIELARQADAWWHDTGGKTVGHYESPAFKTNAHNAY